MTKNYNLNCESSVILTDYGAKIYNNFQSRFNFPAHLQPKKLKGGDTLKLPLWELMQIFGDLFHMGMIDMPFNKNIISIKEELYGL